MLAGAHDVILRLPKGYDTPIGAAAWRCRAASQRGRSRRALYGAPGLVFSTRRIQPRRGGERALAQAIHRLRAERCTVIVVTHRPHCSPTEQTARHVGSARSSRRRARRRDRRMRGNKVAAVAGTGGRKASDKERA